jgi:hypothetical protein
MGRRSGPNHLTRETNVGVSVRARAGSEMRKHEWDARADMYSIVHQPQNKKGREIVTPYSLESLQTCDFTEWVPRPESDLSVHSLFQSHLRQW